MRGACQTPMCVRFLKFQRRRPENIHASSFVPARSRSRSRQVLQALRMVRLRRGYAPFPAVRVVVTAAVTAPLHELRTAGARARPVEPIFLEHGAGLPSLYERARLFGHSEILRDSRSFPTVPRRSPGGRARRQRARRQKPWLSTPRATLNLLRLLRHDETPDICGSGCCRMRQIAARSATQAQPAGSQEVMPVGLV